MKIYFLHSISDLNSEYERLCIEQIKELYPRADIINAKAMLSRNDKLTLERTRGKGFREVIGKLGYFIDMSDIVIVAKTWSYIAFRGRFTPEMKAELEYAKKKRKKILGDVD